DAEGDHIRQRVQLAAEGGSGLAPACDPAIEGIKNKGQRDQPHADHQIDHHAFLQEAHRGEDRTGSAERVAQGEPVRKLELAKHREMAWWLHGWLRWSSPSMREPGQPACQRARVDGKRQWLTGPLAAQW